MPYSFSKELSGSYTCQVYSTGTWGPLFKVSSERHGPAGGSLKSLAQPLHDLGVSECRGPFQRSFPDKTRGSRK